MKNLKKALLITFFSSGVSILLSGCGGGGTTAPDAPAFDLIPPNSGLPLPEESFIPPPTNQEKMGADLWHNNGFTGNGSIVAVLDSGTDNVSVDYDVTLVESVRYDYTYTDDWSNPSDDGYIQRAGPLVSSPHGDEMSQIIGSNVAGIGIAPDATLIHGVISEGGLTNSASMWKGLDWANKNNAVVANLSFEFGGLFEYTGTDAEIIADPFASKHDLTNKAISADIVSSGMAIVHSAGNSNANLSNLVYSDATSATIIYTPLKDSLVIVGALDDTLNAKADYSNYAGADTFVQDRFLMAPGTNTIQVNGSEGFSTGTSPAAAYVSGAIAMMKSRWTGLTGKELAQILLNTANNSFAGYDAFYHGQGKLDLIAAYSPIGEASFKTADAKSIPLKAATIIMPSGFAEQTFTAAFVDQYDRDYEVSFSTQESTYSSDFSNKLLSAISNTKDVAVGALGGASLFVKEGYTGYEKELPVVGFNSFSKEMFSNAKNMQSIKALSGDLEVNVSTNLSEQLSPDRNSTGKGLKADIGYRDVTVSLYQSSEHSGLGSLFYGVQRRDATGLKLAYENAGFMLGVEVSNQSYKGDALVNEMNVERKAVSLGYNLLQSHDFTFGIIGKVEESSADLSMTLPRSNGDGSLYYKSETLKTSSNLLSKGVYLQKGMLNISAYADEQDQNVALTLKTTW